MPETTEVFQAGFSIEVLEAKESDDGQTGYVKALVSAYNVDYRMGWRTNHRILDGAFAKYLAGNAMTPMFWQHNWNWSEQPPIGTAEASEQGAGLIIEANFFLDIEAGRAVFKAIRNKALREWSIGYRILKYVIEGGDDGDNEAEDDFQTVQVEEAELLEVSSVLRGANPKTDTLKVASEMPADIYEALLRVSTWMKAQGDINDIVEERLNGHDAALMGETDWHSTFTALSQRVDALEALANGLPDEAPAEADKPGGEEGSVEPADCGGGEEDAEAASAPPVVPDFLPPAPEGSEALTDDIGAITRVQRAWTDCVRREEVRSLIRQ